MSARWSGRWAAPAEERRPVGVEVLIPTFERPAELATTLSGLAAQTDMDFGVIISDQGRSPAWEASAVAAMVGVLRAQGRDVRLERHLPPRGLAEQRDFLLHQSRAPRVLFLDDDVWLEPGMLRRLDAALLESGCGFVGAAVQGLSYLEDRRPQEWEAFEPWDGSPAPELVERGTPAFERWRLHNAANLTHVALTLDLPEGDWLLYKVAWVGACVLYDREKLVSVGGFGFWRSLPPAHAGEDAAAQARVMAAFGGAGLLPSGAVHLESPTTVPDRSTEARDVVPLDPAVPLSAMGDVGGVRGAR
ncbi:MAG TPA: glycosyltransferase family 2 protein [Propionibacteriaceae bacterium]|nr:glycosyltransferase family 2 protein [Propionibacteriaceae bacterium]